MDLRYIVRDDNSTFYAALAKILKVLTRPICSRNRCFTRVFPLVRWLETAET